MSSFNKVILMGRLTRNPELRYTPQGTAVTEIGLAINREFSAAAGAERRKEVTFVDVTLWSRAAEVVCQYLKKGSPIFIEGRLSLDTWEGPDGQKRSKLRVIAENFKFVGGRSEGGGDDMGEGMGSQEEDAPRGQRSGMPSASPRYSPPRRSESDRFSRVPEGETADPGEGPLGVDDSDIPF
jgi:single-strand DNA-binding protein